MGVVNQATRWGRLSMDVRTAQRERGISRASEAQMARRPDGY